MKKIDILNFITSFRKAPNDIKTYQEILSSVGKGDEAQLKSMIEELKQTRVLKEIEDGGEKKYQVVTK
ncbi:MAG: hypothetical protein HOP08_02990 [Cyclobacteriaceae bacterium]|nr:hypothetical protein [Cyclobacteriaceae bacterium]